MGIARAIYTPRTPSAALRGPAKPALAIYTPRTPSAALRGPAKPALAIYTPRTPSAALRGPAKPALAIYTPRTPSAVLRGPAKPALAICALLLIGGTASADAKLDWARGLVIADGVGVADRHAPSPAIARSTARRGADDAAKRAIATAVRAIPLAAGGTLGERAKDPAIATRIDAAVARAMTLAADPDTDGAWHVTLAVPLEALRQAIDGPRAFAGGDVGPAVVVVDVAATPALGYRVANAPVATAWRAPSADLANAPHTTATVAHGNLVLAKPLGNAATLYVIVQAH